MMENIQLYSLSTCSHCLSTKKLLSRCEVHYEFTDVDLLDIEERKAILEDIRSLNPECSFPTVVIGKEVIVGFDEKKIRSALGFKTGGIGFLKKIISKITGRS